MDKAEKKSTNRLRLRDWEWFPSISKRELLDFLQGNDCAFQTYDPKTQRYFNKVVFCDESFICPDYLLNDSKALIVCDKCDFEGLHETLPFAFFLIATDGLNTDECEFRNNVAVVYSSAKELYSFIRELFNENLLWESRLDYAVYREERIPLLLDIAMAILKDGIICITDTGFNLIAASHSNELPSRQYETLLKCGIYSSSEIAILENKIANSKQTGDYFEIKSHSDNEAYSIHYPIFIDGSYVYHVTYAVKPEKFTMGTVDRFLKVAKRVLALGTMYWQKNMLVASSCHKLLISLIEGQKRDYSEVRAQMKQAEIPTDASYRLISIKFSKDIRFGEGEKIIKAVANLNSGKCHAFFFKNKLIILTFNEENNPTKSSLFKLIKELDELVYTPFHITASISQVFSSIKNINYAFRQCTLAFQNKKAVMRLFPGGYEAVTRNAWPCYPFDHVLPFISLESSADAKFVEYSMNENNLMKTLRRDKGFESESIDVVWLYLTNERNATKVADLVHAHRNTVLYQIKKFEKRYDIKLDLPMVRMRIRFDYMYWMANIT